MRGAIIVMAAMVYGSAWAADLYKWQDDDGITRYSDQMPPPGAKSVQKLKSTANLLAVERAASMPNESLEATKKHPISLYAFDDCGEGCKNAQAFLDKRGVPYALKTTNDDKIQLKQLTGKLEAPALVLGNTSPIVGFSENRWNRELDLAGYAKSNPYLKPGSSLASKPQAKVAAEAAQETPNK